VQHLAASVSECCEQPAACRSGADGQSTFPFAEPVQPLVRYFDWQVRVLIDQPVGVLRRRAPVEVSDATASPSLQADWAHEHPNEPGALLEAESWERKHQVRFCQPAAQRLSPFE
jgi:hypothetical protein